MTEKNMTRANMGTAQRQEEAPVRNTSPDFVGVDGVKARQREHLGQFERWAAKRDWGRFHGSHYDCWMFPIDRASGGEGMKWTVYAGDVEELKRGRDSGNGVGGSEHASNQSRSSLAPEQAKTLHRNAPSLGNERA